MNNRKRVEDGTKPWGTRPFIGIGVVIVYAAEADRPEKKMKIQV